MDERWNDWYQATLRPLLDYFLSTQDTQERQDVLLRDTTSTDLALLAADTNRIQAYIFESAKLPEVRGGSEMLRELNEEKVIEILINTGLPGGFIDDPDPGCIVYAGGGSLLAFVPASIASQLAEQIEALYPSETGMATITCVFRPVTPQEVIYGLSRKGQTQDWLNSWRAHLSKEDWQRVVQSFGVTDDGDTSQVMTESQPGFGQMVQVMGMYLQRRKDRPVSIPVVETLPFAVRCQVCQVRPAQRVYQYFDASWPLCEVCRRKVSTGIGGARKERRQQVYRFVEWLERNRADLFDRYRGETSGAPIYLAQDTRDLGEACRSRPGYIGFVYADGNRMGQVLEYLPTPQACRQFSRALQESLRLALYEALAENLSSTLIERTSPTGQSLGQGFVHPLEPLLMGGDDVMFLVPGDAAFPIAVRLCQLFERNMATAVSDEIWGRLPEVLRHPTLSAGVVIATDHNPVSILQQISKDLCKNAKRRAYIESQAGVYTSAVDFLVLKSQSMLRRDVNQLRDGLPYYYDERPAGSSQKRGRYLTAAPYTLPESLHLLKILRRMRQVEFPVSQLQGLVAALQRGRRYGSIAYLYQRARLSVTRGQDKNILAYLADVWPYDVKEPLPWHRIPGEEGRTGRVLSSIVPDLLELYPFVPKQVDELWQTILSEADYE